MGSVAAALYMSTVWSVIFGFAAGILSAMGMGGGSDTVFSSSARGLDALLARVTVVLAVLFGVLTLFIAKLTSF